MIHQVTNFKGNLEAFNITKLEEFITYCCSNIPFVNKDFILEQTLKNLYEGVKKSEINQTVIMAGRPLIEKEPDYKFVCARVLLHSVYKEAARILDIKNRDYMSIEFYKEFLPKYIEMGISDNRINPKLAEFDIEWLSEQIISERDFLFDYLGLQTIYDRYLLHKNNVKYEIPQVMFMRVAMGLSINEGEFNLKAKEFYDLLSSMDYMSSTPTLFNSGLVKSQLSSCYITTIQDDIHSIFEEGIATNAYLQKWAGGVGNDWTNVRALGSKIKGTNGISQGIVSFLKIANDTAIAIDQGSKRKGAVCSYLEVWHLDFEEYTELRKNTGDDRRRTHDMNTASWVNDLFMKRLIEEKEWTLFSPDIVPDLHSLYGKAFEERYEYYESLVDSGEINLYKRLPAIELWRKILNMLFETGHPWVTFKDSFNIRNPQQHVGVINSSNLCTEIALNTSSEEIAVCNLGSINLVNHLTKDKYLDYTKIEKTINTAIRMLDNVIDLNYYPVEAARNSNMKHRPIGLGIMGFQDMLYNMKISYNSPQAVEMADVSMEMISYYAIKASSQLAKERGTYQTYEGSLWDKGIFPLDSLKMLQQERGEKYLSYNNASCMDWDSLKEFVKENGMRNSNVMAIAPTATISNICNVSQSIESTYQNLYVKSNLSGEFTYINPYLINELKEINMWNDDIINELKINDGSVQNIYNIPDYIKERYKTSFEIEPRFMVESAARRQKWIDQAQSFNIYVAEANGKKVDTIYKMCWYLGLKSTYYLRARGATSTEKSTVETNNLNAVKVNLDEPVKFCSIENPDCEACQ